MSGRDTTPDDTEDALEPEILAHSEEEVREADIAPILLDPPADGARLAGRVSGDSTVAYAWAYSTAAPRPSSSPSSR